MCIRHFKWLLIWGSGLRDRKWKSAGVDFFQAAKLKYVYIRALVETDETVWHNQSDSISSREADVEQLSHPLQQMRDYNCTRQWNNIDSVCY